MNAPAKIAIRHSTCPHDCPSACALDIEVIDGSTIGRVRGSKLQSYTAGVVCAKVARYAERIHHPERLLYPMRRSGPKGSGQFERIAWDDALDEIARRFNEAERTHGSVTRFATSQSVMPSAEAPSLGSGGTCEKRSRVVEAMIGFGPASCAQRANASRLRSGTSGTPSKMIDAEESAGCASCLRTTETRAIRVSTAVGSNRPKLASVASVL